MTEVHQDEGSAGLDASPPDSSDQAIIKQLNALNSEDFQTRLAAVTALGALDHGNEASLRALERVAQDDSRPVREAALQALEAPVYRILQRSSNRLTGPVRERILAEIERWAADGLIAAHTARLLTQRYQFAEPATQKVPEAEPDKPRPSYPNSCSVKQRSKWRYTWVHFLLWPPRLFWPPYLRLPGCPFWGWPQLAV